MSVDLVPAETVSRGLLRGRGTVSEMKTWENLYPAFLFRGDMEENLCSFECTSVTVCSFILRSEYGDIALYRDEK